MMAAAAMTPRDAHHRLTALGYMPPRLDPGEDAEAFRQAVMAFQGYERLTRDGVLGPRTRRALARAERPTPRTRRAGVEVDITRQVALVVGRRGQVLRAIHVSTGKTGNTPRGNFTIFRRERMSWSVPFSSWMPYANYFHGGFALHQYDDVPPFPASHGCVRLPASQARYVWDNTRMGDSVRVY